MKLLISALIGKLQYNNYLISAVYHYRKALFTIAIVLQ